MQRTKTYRALVRCLTGCCALQLCLVGWSSPTYGDWRDDVGYTTLINALGNSTPNGAGVPISLVEAGGSNFLPDKEHSEFSAATDPFSEGYDPAAPNSSMFINGSLSVGNGISNHATSQARTFFGNTSSIAPAANNVVTVYEANDYLENVLGLDPKDNIIPGSPNPDANNRDPLPQDFRVQNFSWIGSFGSTTTTPHASNVLALRAFDYVIDTNEVTAVVGLNNGTGGIPYLLGHSYNAIVAGVSDGDHSRGLTLSPTRNGYGPGRLKPSLVAPRTTTSAATSSISSAATLLHSSDTIVNAVTLAVSDTAAANSETMRAILLAGATKKEFDTFVDPDSGSADPWNRTPTQPLDNIFGAGELNVLNSWLITQRGNFVGTTSTPLAAVGSYGWDYQTVNPGSDVEYLFEIPAGKTAQELSIILTWNYEVTDTNSDSAVFDPVESLANLDLELVDSFGETIDESISTSDNIEHIYFTDLGPGSYTLKVSTDLSRDYGLAWRTSSLFGILETDFDFDGDTDGADFLAWQRGFGTPASALQNVGDADGDNDVDADDLALISTYFDSPQTSLATLAVPEPASWVFAVIGILWTVGLSGLRGSPSR